MTKQAIIEALRRFVNQRSGIEFRNYWTSDAWNSRTAAREAFMGDYQPILKYGRHARAMLAQVELRDSITAENIVEGTRAYSGRLKLVERGGKVAVDYTIGQYFPTEYRAAACAVLAQCLWDYWAPDCKNGGEIRKTAARQLGRGIAAVWFK